MGLVAAFGKLFEVFFVFLWGGILDDDTVSSFTHIERKELGSAVIHGNGGCDLFNCEGGVQVICFDADIYRTVGVIRRTSEEKRGKVVCGGDVSFVGMGKDNDLVADGADDIIAVSKLGDNLGGFGMARMTDEYFKAFAVVAFAVLYPVVADIGKGRGESLKGSSDIERRFHNGSVHRQICGVYDLIRAYTARDDVVKLGRGRLGLDRLGDR